MFLGHLIGEGQVKMDPRKIQAIDEWPAPKTVPELRSFFGLANYCRRCIQAFEKLKTVVASTPVLGLSDFEKTFKVHTDASDKAIGGVLVQDGHPIAFESRKLNDAE
ncbi:hypothetical protein DKX38_024469 [Salix brachista]|uniref:Reverse transcriptase/retrotransposon-derived protein RNase H-like domain-containing protein n=1 Tax=Salix brachista TaxID=2182728 RepID=A0A5N5JRT3_9ROSI|nr:hypothetical protein DKX38_024469 [Salix brachista]